MAPNNHPTPPPAETTDQRLRKILLEQRRAGLLLVDSAERELRQLGWQPGDNGRHVRRGRINADTKEGNGG